METERLLLRNWQDSDAAALYELCCDEAMRRSGIPVWDNVEACRDAIGFMKDDTGRKVLEDRITGDFAGYASLGGMNRYDGYMELEYAIAKAYRGRGYAAEAVKGMLACGFCKMGLEVIAAWVRSHNEGSVRVLEKCGFILEGRLRRHARDKSDTLCYSVLREEWERMGVKPHGTCGKN